MYSTSSNTFQSQGQIPPMGMYPSNIMNIPPQGPPLGTHMIITAPGVLYGDVPIQCTCPNCYQPIVTRVEKKTGLLTWLICGGIVLVGGWLGCCLIPFCVDGLQVS
jgi:lipopolysaccharide-induced tumor necrosis factor-alpha factor